MTVEECAPVLRAVAEPIRLRLLSLLREGPLHVAAITERLEVQQYQASRHLSALLGLGLVARERRGKRVYYTLAPGVGSEDPTLDLGCCRLSVE